MQKISMFLATQEEEFGGRTRSPLRGAARMGIHESLVDPLVTICAELMESFEKMMDRLGVVG
jgi:hypothetical protein